MSIFLTFPVLNGLTQIAIAGHIVCAESQLVDNADEVTEFFIHVQRDYVVVNKLILRYREKQGKSPEWEYNSPSLHGVGNFHRVTISKFLEIVDNASEIWLAHAKRDSRWFNNY